MKKHLKRMKTSETRQERLILGVAAALAILAVGATASIARRARQANDSLVQRSHERASKYTAIESAARSVRAGVRTGQVRPLTQEEAQKLAQGIKELVNQSTDGLLSVQHSDGSVSMDLKGRFQNAAVAKRTEDGMIRQSCVDNPRAAAAFFEFDPQLLQGQTKPGPGQTNKPGVTERPKR